MAKTNKEFSDETLEEVFATSASGKGAKRGKYWVCRDLRILAFAYHYCGLSSETVRTAIQFVLRKFDGSLEKNKYEKCRNWSVEAKRKGETLVCEHVVPIKLFLDAVLDPNSELLKKNDEELEAFLKSHLLTAVITKDEDGRLEKDAMPSGKTLLQLKNAASIWSRYKKAEIEIADE